VRFLIIGAGAIGSLVGGRLALAGHRVTLVGRDATVSAVRRLGLRRGGPHIDHPRDRGGGLRG